MKKLDRKAFWMFCLTVLSALAILLVLPDRLGKTQESLESQNEPGAVFTVTSSADSGAGSLRQAITDANASAGTDTIQFQIGTGAVDINLSSALPDITGPVIIDGTTQTGFTGTPLVNLVGGFLGGLKITGGGSTVNAIAVTSSGLGITLDSGGGNIVTGCYIGICPQNPTASCGNFENGILINNSANNQIGGTTDATRNIISGNGFDGVEITGSASTGNIITGNYIGLRADGTVARNTDSGVAIMGAPNNRVGGTTAGERNIISGNGQGSDLPGNQFKSAVLISGAAASGNIVQGNYIGTTIDGTAVVPGGSRLNGVRIDNAPNNTVGGTAGTTPGGACTGACNVISGILLRGGVVITGSGATGNSVLGNFIGTNAAGTSNLANNVGVTITNAASNNTVGGTTASARNLITNGMVVTSGAATNTVQGNYIGTDTTGNVGIGTGTLFPNILVGVGIDSSTNNSIGTSVGTTLGGACTGGCNLISGHIAAHGIFITGNGSTGNRVDYNYIGLNAAGTAALRNGGDAITLRNGANNNIIGRPLATTPFHETKQVENVPEAIVCIKSDSYPIYLQYDDETLAFEAKDCRSGVTLNGTGSLDISSDGNTRFRSIDNRISALIDFSRIPPRATADIGLPGYIFTFPVFDGNVTNSACVCPTEGEQNIAGDLSSGASPNEPNPPNDNTINSNSLGWSSNRLSRLSLPLTDGYVRHRAGNFNTYANLDIATNGDSFAALSLASGTDNFVSGANVNAINPGQFSFSPIELAPGANRDIASPQILGILKELGGLRVLGTFSGAPNTNYRIWIYGSNSTTLSTGVREQINYTGQTLLIRTDVNGNYQIDQGYSGVDEFILCRSEKVALVVTQINAVPITSENSRASFVDVPGDTSEFSLPATVPQPRFDFDEDGKTDIAVYRPGATPSAESFWYILNSSDFSFRVVQFGIGEDKLVAGDYQGDGVADFAVFRPSTGTWYHSRLTGNPSTNFIGVQWGVSTDIPVPGDYDDDGALDQAVFRPSEGVWYIRRSIDGSVLIYQFGIPTDKPAAGDYNGDGQTDFAIYRNGQWWIAPCAGCPARAINFGLATDTPVPGVDFDGDGADDIAVVRNEGGGKTWHWLESGSGNYRAAPFGLASDKVLAGDFDADGKSDLAIFRPSEGNWYVQRSEQGLLVINWGLNSDIPVPSVMIP